jgi:hypothetical protein
MTHVATLIADPAAPVLDDAAATIARTILPSPGVPDWLAPAVAVDLPFSPRGPLDERALAARLRGILAPRPIDFAGGGRGVEELARRVTAGDAAAAFSLYPTQMVDLMAVADAGEIMPPKSTWFEPKLADGMVSHVLD